MVCTCEHNKFISTIGLIQFQKDKKACKFCLHQIKPLDDLKIWWRFNRKTFAISTIMRIICFISFLYYISFKCFCCCCCFCCYTIYFHEVNSKVEKIHNSTAKRFFSAFQAENTIQIFDLECCPQHFLCPCVFHHNHYMNIFCCYTNKITHVF